MYSKKGPYHGYNFLCTITYYRTFLNVTFISFTFVWKGACSGSCLDPTRTRFTTICKITPFWPNWKSIKDISLVLFRHYSFYVRKLLRFRFSLPGHKLVLHSTISFVSPHSSPPFSGSDSICLVLAVDPVPHDLVQALQLLHMVNLQSTKWRF